MNHGCPCRAQREHDEPLRVGHAFAPAALMSGARKFWQKKTSAQTPRPQAGPSTASYSYLRDRQPENHGDDRGEDDGLHQDPPLGPLLVRLGLGLGREVEESYEGEWQDGLRQGRGVYRYREQDSMKSYDGDWLSNLRHGKGQLEYRDGGYYKGDWVNERMTGRGLYVWPDGSQYEGQWQDNMRHGEGTELSASGTVYRGRYWKNMRHGPGVMTYLNGNSYEGIWDNDKIRGRGRYTILTGEKGGSSDTVKLRVFGY